MVYIHFVSTVKWHQCGKVDSMHTKEVHWHKKQVDLVAKSRLPRVAKQLSETLGVNPYLLCSNKSRPHLFTYITVQERQERAVLVREWSWIWQGLYTTHEAFFRTEGYPVTSLVPMPSLAPVFDRLQYAKTEPEAEEVRQPWTLLIIKTF